MVCGKLFLPCGACGGAPGSDGRLAEGAEDAGGGGGGSLDGSFLDIRGLARSEKSSVLKGGLPRAAPPRYSASRARSAAISEAYKASIAAARSFRWKMLPAPYMKLCRSSCKSRAV